MSTERDDEWDAVDGPEQGAVLEPAQMPRRSLFDAMSRAQDGDRRTMSGVRWMSETSAGRAERDRLWMEWRKAVAQRELNNANDMHADAAFVWWMVGSAGVLAMPVEDHELVGRAMLKLREMAVELCKTAQATPATRMSTAVQKQVKIQALRAAQEARRR